MINHKIGDRVKLKHDPNQVGTIIKIEEYITGFTGITVKLERK